MISEELLKEVMGDEVTKCIPNGNNIIFKEYRTMIDRSHLVNIHELAHKCKTWASLQRKQIVSYSGSSCFYIEVINIDTGKIEFKVHGTEPDGVFKVCEWIQNQKENNEQ